MEASGSDSKVTPLREKNELDRLRTLPRNFEVEQALLGAVLMENRAYLKVSEFLLPEHFANPVHGRIYAAAAHLIERGQLADPMTLKAYFEQDDALDDIGGTAYLAQLAAAAVTTFNAGDYGRTIHDLYLRRQLIALGEDMTEEAHRPDIEVSAVDQIEQVEQQLYDLATTGQIEGGFQPFKGPLTEAIAAAEIAYKREGKMIGISTGFVDLDKLLGGMHNSDLLVLAGRPSMGKTALATNIAFHAAKARARDTRKKPLDGAVVGFFSLEMSAEQLATRILAEEAKVPSEKIRRGELSHTDFEKVAMAAQDLATVPFFIDDTPALTIGALRTRARRLKRQHGLSLIVVDYLQLLSPSRTRQDNRVLEISEITRGLKTLAKELNVPVLALSQLSRAVEQREDKRPQLADLRESGSIEQDADVVVFIYREEYYLARQQPPEGTDKHIEWQEKMDDVHNKAEILISKQRHGPTGKLRLFFDGRFTKFADLDERPADAPF
ncbi:MAG: replicative DNA helicase [Alphaproteobacteria bacterium]|nr:replicative DNA helicase [Alphaproteobacteria bacterium]